MKREPLAELFVIAGFVALAIVGAIAFVAASGGPDGYPGL